MQSGIGILGFQRIIAQPAGYDAWMAVIIAGLTIHIILWMMYKMLSTVNGDIVTIHRNVFGEKIAKVLNVFFMLYFCLLTITLIRNFIEIIQVWMFENLEVFWFALVFLILTIYVVNGGFRTVTGIAFFSVVLPAYIIFLFIAVIPHSEFINLLPIFDHSVKDILEASRKMTLTMLGFETLLFFYPFIKNPEKSKKWAHFGVLYTTILCLYLAILTFSYFSEGQLQRNVWPTLTMWKIIKLPFVERFEYIGIASWCLVILPNACICLWCASRLAKNVFSLRQKTAVLVFALICLLTISFIETREQINLLTDIISKAGFYFNFIYIPILFVITWIIRKVKSRENHS